MPDLIPVAETWIANDRDAFGFVAFQEETITWDLRAYLSYGKNGGQFSGLSLDPTGQYVTQAASAFALNADPTEWTELTGGTFSYGTDGSGSAAGVKFLRGVATEAGAMIGISSYTRLAEEGVEIGLYRSEVGAGVSSSCYLYFQPAASTEDNYRLSIVPGVPISLQSSPDGVTWADVQVAYELGESENYLSSHNRQLSISVVPMTDPTWYDGLPGSAQLSGPPPNLLVVNINNGDSTLSLPAQTFPGDALVAFAVTGGQFSLRLARRGYAVSASAALPEQVRARDFAVSATPRRQGYVPYYTSATPFITQTDTNKAASALSVSAPADGVTGLSVYTVFLSTLDADFEAVQVAPLASPDWAVSFPVHARAYLSWDQATGTLRSEGTATYTSNNDEFAPGAGVSLGVRAGQMRFGYAGYDGTQFRSGVQPVLTGWTGLASGKGLGWAYRSKQKYFTASFHDKLRKGDADQISCGYRLPDDGQNHFYVQRKNMHRLGITDDWLNFPIRERDDNQPDEYYLPRGTTLDPLFLAHPSTPVGQHAERVRRVAGVYDGSSGQILPLALGTNPDGYVDYFGLPVGVVNAFTGPGYDLIPLITFSAVPEFWSDGSPVLNEILDSGLETAASLANIRTDIVLEGLDPTSGGAVIGVAKNDVLGGPYANPDAPGYVSAPIPFYDIDRAYASPEVAEVAVQLAQIQLQFPAIQVSLKVYYQSWLFPLMIFAVQDFGTTGSEFPVLFYVTDIVHEYDGLSDPERPTGFSYITGRLLGQI